jgi:hypothetical protein
MNDLGNGLNVASFIFIAKSRKRPLERLKIPILGNPANSE